jgi:glycosyltransferase involved in cell wall biosynthesis
MTISVALAAYNGSPYLRLQLESIARQSMPPSEVILCDDGSSDDTLSIAADFSRFLNLTVHRNETRLGHVQNFAQAISLCQCDLIALSDQDDVWLPGKLERLSSAIGDRALVHSDAQVIDAAGTVTGRSWSGHYNKKLRLDRLEYLNGTNNVTGCTALFRRSILPQMLPIPRCVPSHDGWAALVASTQGGIAYVDEPLMQYRLHASNAIGARKRIESRRASYVRRQEYFEQVLQAAARIGLDAPEEEFARSMVRYYRNKRSSLLSWENSRIARRYYRVLYDGRRPMTMYILSSMVGSLRDASCDS